MNATTMTIAPVRKTPTVNANRHACFEVFTARIGHWWPRSKSINTSAMAAVIVEPRVGGRWYERGEDGSECEWGKVLFWDPPARLVLAWQIDGSWKYNPACVTEVELQFHAVTEAVTRVEFEHRGLEQLGENAAAVRDMLDSGWPGILALYAKEATSFERKLNTRRVDIG